MESVHAVDFEMAQQLFEQCRGHGGVVDDAHGRTAPTVADSLGHLLRQSGVEVVVDLHLGVASELEAVADSTGRSAILEWVAKDDDSDTDGSARELKVYYNDDDAALGTYEERNDFQYVTNFIVTPDYYSNEESMKGYDRYQAIEKAINSDGSNVNGVVTADEAMDVLKMVGRRKWDKEQGKSDSNSITVWSALYNLTDRTVTWVSNEEYGNSDAIFKLGF